MTRSPYERVLFCATTATVLASALAFASEARADKAADDRAQALFDQGDALMKAQRYGEACAKFAESQTVSPSGGAVIKLGECNDKLGNAADAYNYYMGGAELAHAAGKPDVEAYVRDRANAQRSKVAIVTIDADLAPGEEVYFDDQPLRLGDWSKGRAVTPQEHKLSARAPQRTPFVLPVRPNAGESRALHVPALAPGNDPGPHPSNQEASSTQRWAGVAVGSVGIAGVIVGAVFGGLALSTNKDALRYCDSKGIVCQQKGLDLTSRADAFAHASTTLLVVGGVLTGVGVVVFATAPKGTGAAKNTALRISPTFGFGVAGGTIEGEF